jgi:hypothetical protein
MQIPYPQLGTIQVAKNGSCIVHVWPNESNGECFSGVELLTSDVSCRWLRSAFETDNIFKRPLLRQYMQARRKARRR